MNTSVGAWLVGIGAVLVAIVLVITLLVGMPVRVRGASAGRSVTALGSGTVAVTPDRATLILGVQNSAADARTSLANNQARMARVLSAVRTGGVPASHVQTTDLNMYYDTTGQVYTVNQSVTVALDSIKQVGKILDTAVAAGANTSTNISFTVANTSLAHTQAVDLALADARTRARAMARRMGLTLGQVTHVEEVTGAAAIPVSGLGGGGGGGPQPGRQGITAQVAVTYAVR